MKTVKTINNSDDIHQDFPQKDPDVVVTVKCKNKDLPLETGSDESSGIGSYILPDKSSCGSSGLSEEGSTKINPMRGDLTGSLIIERIQEDASLGTSLISFAENSTDLEDLARERYAENRNSAFKNSSGNSVDGMKGHAEEESFGTSFISYSEADAGEVKVFGSHGAEKKSEYQFGRNVFVSGSPTMKQNVKVSFSNIEITKKEAKCGSSGMTDFAIKGDSSRSSGISSGGISEIAVKGDSSRSSVISSRGISEVAVIGDSSRCSGMSSKGISEVAVIGDSSRCSGMTSRSSEGALKEYSSRCSGMTSKGISEVALKGDSSRCSGMISKGISEVALKGDSSRCSGMTSRGISERAIMGDSSRCSGMSSVAVEQVIENESSDSGAVSYLQDDFEDIGNIMDSALLKNFKNSKDMNIDCSETLPTPGYSVEQKEDSATQNQLLKNNKNVANKISSPIEKQDLLAKQNDGIDGTVIDSPSNVSHFTNASEVTTHTSNASHFTSESIIIPQTESGSLRGSAKKRALLSIANAFSPTEDSMIVKNIHQEQSMQKEELKPHQSNTIEEESETKSTAHENNETTPTLSLPINDATLTETKITSLNNQVVPNGINSMPACGSDLGAKKYTAQEEEATDATRLSASGAEGFFIGSVMKDKSQGSTQSKEMSSTKSTAALQYLLPSSATKEGFDIRRLIVVSVIVLIGGLYGSIFAETSCHFATIHEYVGYYESDFSIHVGMWKYSPVDSVFTGYSYCTSYGNSENYTVPYTRIIGLLAVSCGLFATAVVWCYLLFVKTTDYLWKLAWKVATLAGLLQLATILFFTEELCRNYVCNVGPGSVASLIASVCWWILAYEMLHNVPTIAKVDKTKASIIELPTSKSSVCDQRDTRTSMYQAPYYTGNGALV